MKRHAYALLAALILCSANAHAQGWNVDLVSERYDNWSNAKHIAKQGNYAYLGTEWGGLAVVDISDRTDPMGVAFILPDENVNDVEVAGNYAYLGISGGGLLILDISNPANPTWAAQILQPRNVKDVCVAGNLAYVIYSVQSQGDRMSILDITDPTNPETIGEFTFPVSASDPSASGNYLYVPMWSGGLWILDVSNPGNPALVGSLGGLWGNCYDVAVSQDVAYLSMNVGGMYTIDVSDPAHPAVLGQLVLSSWVDAIEVSGGLAYVGTISDGLFIVDVSRPSHPVILGNYAGPGYNSPLRQLVVEEPYVYGAWDEYHLRITDVSNPQNPTPISSYYTDWWIGDVAWQGNYAYLAAGNDGLLINDVSNPANPWQASYFNDMGYVSDVLIRGNYAYVQTDSAPDLKIVDVSNPLSPVMAGSYNLPDGRIYKFVDNLAYATADEGILKILDLSDPIHPVEIGSYNQPGAYLRNLDTDGRILYAMSSDYYGGDSLLILDVNDPTNPQFLALYYSEDVDRDLVLGDGYLYAAGWLTGFIVYSVADPARLMQVGYLTLDELWPSELVLSGNFVYLTSNHLFQGLRVIDVSDPTNPILAGYYDTEGLAEAVAVNGDYAYVADWDYFEIYDCSHAIHNDVNIIMTPINPPIIIPASGGSFSFNATLENQETAPNTFDVWIMVQLPSGSWWGPALGPVSLTLPGSGTLTRLRTQTVPASAPAGDYWYEGRVGDYPNWEMSNSGFVFTKSATGDGPWVGNWACTGEEIGETEKPLITNQLALLTSVQPNPFNPTTAIRYQLSADSYVNLKIYDTAGRLVTTLVDGWRLAGVHQVTFDGSDLPSGVYLIRLAAGGFTSAAKLVLLK